MKDKNFMDSPVLPSELPTIETLTAYEQLFDYYQSLETEMQSSDLSRGEYYELLTLENAIV